MMKEGKEKTQKGKKKSEDGKKKSEDATVGEALIELQKEHNKQDMEFHRTIIEKFEVLISLQKGTAILQGGKETNPYEKIEQMFPAELRELLDLSIKGNNWIAKPRQYLGSENFAKIASIVRAAGGAYVSAGKESHFRGPLPK